MDEKALTAVCTSLALLQIQINALLLLVDRHTENETIREDFQRLVNEGVETVGIKTMEGIKTEFGRGSFSRSRATMETVITDGVSVVLPGLMTLSE